MKLSGLNYLMSEETEEETGKEEPGEDEVYCRSCGEIILEEAEICPECGVRQKQPQENRNSDPGIAAVASALLPGLGQMYNGQIAKGIILLILYSFSFMLIFVFIGLFMVLPIWLFAIYDAYSVAQKSIEE